MLTKTGVGRSRLCLRSGEVATSSRFWAWRASEGKWPQAFYQGSGLDHSVLLRE